MVASSNYERRAQRIRAALSARRMESWRKLKASLLCPVMKQNKSTCYAIAYVRQLEFQLKLHNRMPQDQHLSIQDFINHIPKHFLASDGSLIVDSSLVLSILKEKGILLEKDCALTESLVDTVDERTMNLPRYYAKKVKMHKLHRHGSELTDDRYDYFHGKLLQQLKRGVVAVVLTVYPSYSKLKHKHIYYPTNKELAGETESYTHVMVCTGHNYDKKKSLYYEFQESAGVKVGDKGFVRIYADVVFQFVEMEVYMED